MRAQPVFSHLSSHQIQNGEILISGAHRVLEQADRLAVHCTSIKSLLQFTGHTLGNEQGALSLWVLPMEDLQAYRVRDVMFTKANKNPWVFPLLCDQPDLGNVGASAFALNFDVGWHPSLECKFYRGDNFWDILDPPHKAHAVASHFDFQRYHWYQMTVCWDFTTERIAVYANGVLVAAEDTLRHAFVRDQPSPTLYAGKSVFAFGQLDCYDQWLDTSSVQELYAEQAAAAAEPQLVEQLRASHAGRDHKPFLWQPDANWDLAYERRLTEPDLLDEWSLQGEVAEMAVEAEGLRIRTPALPYNRHNHERQMYLWSPQCFEGDIAIEVEFQPLQDFGLALLLFHGSGMSREDVFTDYPPRTSGAMSDVHSSDLRNYHLEFYRRMHVVRNDVASMAMIKNPYQWPLAYGTQVERLAVGAWHRLQVVMVEGHVQLAMNGRVWAEGQDYSHANNGPILNFGRVALRCMIDTHMRFRNLRIYSRRLPYRVVPGDPSDL